jgi:hypothetical protein
MHAPFPDTIVTILGRQQEILSGYFLAGVLLHAVTAIELILLLAVAGIAPHPVRETALALLGVAALFTQLDARSRFQEYKRVRDQLIRYGPDRRIFRSIAASRCRRDAGLAAAKQLGHETACRRFFLAMGYRWYHLLPDFVFRHPRYLLSPAFLRTTFFLPAYSSRFPVAVKSRPRLCIAGSQGTGLIRSLRVSSRSSKTMGDGQEGKTESEIIFCPRACVRWHRVLP